MTIYETTSGGTHWTVVARSMSLMGKPGPPENALGVEVVCPLS